jgi:hypothetical protein
MENDGDFVDVIVLYLVLCWVAVWHCALLRGVPSTQGLSLLEKFISFLINSEVEQKK